MHNKRYICVYLFWGISCVEIRFKFAKKPNNNLNSKIMTSTNVSLTINTGDIIGYVLDNLPDSNVPSNIVLNNTVMKAEGRSANGNAITPFDILLELANDGNGVVIFPQEIIFTVSASPQAYFNPNGFTVKEKAQNFYVSNQTLSNDATTLTVIIDGTDQKGIYDMQFSLGLSLSITMGLEPFEIPINIDPVLRAKQGA
jgi:hypothetical protein